MDNSLKEYYVIPGGGLEKGETLEECIIRELAEELSVEIKVVDYLGNKDTKYFYRCEIVSGNLALGGIEKKKNNSNNFYEIVKIRLTDLDKYLIYDKDMI